MQCEDTYICVTGEDEGKTKEAGKAESAEMKTRSKVLVINTFGGRECR